MSVRVRGASFFSAIAIALAVVSAQVVSPPCAAAVAKTLAQVKPGTAIRTLQDVSIAIPPLLQPILSGDIVLVIQNGRAVPSFMSQGSSEAACLSTSRVIELKDPGLFSMPKDSKFIVKRVVLDKSKHANPLFIGPMTTIEVEAGDASGTHLKGTFQCFPGKPGKTPITIEAFEDVFGRRIRVDSD